MHSCRTGAPRSAPNLRTQDQPGRIVPPRRCDKINRVDSDPVPSGLDRRPSCRVGRRDDVGTGAPVVAGTEGVRRYSGGPPGRRSGSGSRPRLSHSRDTRGPYPRDPARLSPPDGTGTPLTMRHLDYSITWEGAGLAVGVTLHPGAATCDRDCRQPAGCALPATS